jgi:crossover junction endodeoxyribonuclease RusA
MFHVLFLKFPPSVNSIWRSYQGRNILSKRGREYFAEAAAEIKPWVDVTIDTPLQVTIVLTPPDRRKRDIDNSAKVVLDSLTKGGAIADDSLVDRLIIERRPAEKPGQVLVYLEDLPSHTSYR